MSVVILVICHFIYQLLFPAPQFLDCLADHARLDCLQHPDDLGRRYLCIAEMSVASAISDGVDSDDRHWRAGYAQAVTDVMGTLNRYRKI